MYRTGKSYLLNRIILNRKKGFGVGPTVNACTKGLWVWGRPISSTTSDGDSLSIIVIDSEGIGALDEDSDHDVRVFSLAILLASYFIYNSVGSIDENALQNLSLVVNLTKHIHIRSRQREDPGDEDYEKYFPAFLWVVRDFSLQLVTMEGDPITPKEYLEKALMPQKGFTDSIEDKNRIRRFLKHFFKERDCFTMVRPAPTEQDLQRLADLDLEDLRSEFVEQVMILRKKIINKVKPKTLNGRMLSGEMIAKLLESYVGAINGGAVPSIESAWSYICKAECVKAFEDSLELYSKIMQSSVSHRLPINEDELRLFHKEAKEAAIEHFDHKSVGEEKEAMLRNLSSQISQKFTALKEENSVESERQITQFLTEAYGMIDRRLSNGEFPTLSEYEKEIKALKTVFAEHGPEGPRRKELLLDFCAAKHSEASDYFLRHASSELQLAQQLSTEHHSRLETELRETKEETLKQRDSFLRKLTAVESEKAEFAALLTTFKEQTQHLKSERERVEKEQREAQKQIKLDTARQLDEAAARSSQFEESMKELERRLFAAESEHQQEKELLQQKISFLEKSLEESSKREKDYMGELKSQKSGHSSALRDQSSKHDLLLKNYQAKFEAEAEKNGELEKSLAEKEASLEALKAQMEETVKLSSENANELHSQLTLARKQVEVHESQAKDRIQDLATEHETAISRAKARLEETERKLKQSEDAFKAEQTQWLRNNAVLQQKTDFLELQCQDLKSQLDEQKKQNEVYARELQSVSTTDGMEELETQIQRLRDKHSAEVSELERRLEDQRKKSSTVAEELVEKSNSLELKLKLDSNEWAYKEKQFTDKLDAMVEEKAKLAEKVKALMAENTLLNEESATKLKLKIKDLERQMEEMQAKTSRELTVINTKSEESLQQLKNFYEIEKERLEHRIQEEKDKAESRYSFMVEEYEQKIREDSDLANEQRQDLEDQLEELDAIYINDTTLLKQQIALDAQKIETMEKHLKEMKENLASIHTSHAFAMEQQMDSFNKERASLLEKIERLASDSALKEKDLTSMTYKKEQLENLLAFKEKEMEEAKTDFALERNMLMDKLEEAKTKWRLVADELSKKKSEFMKENALNAQQIEFHIKKIAEMMKMREDSDRKYAESLTALKDEKSKEMSEAVEKLTSEKEFLERKVDQKRRALKETEHSYAKQLAAVEKERAVTAEKLANQEAKFSELESRYLQEVTLLQSQLRDKRGTDDSDKVAIQLENEHLKTLASDLEKQLAELTSAYERDKTLWENKFNFLASQRDQARVDLTDSQKKFETALDEVKKKSAAEKEKYESTAIAGLNSVEMRYVGQIKEMQSSLGARIVELSDKNKTLERDFRGAKEQLELERRGRSVDSGTLEERVHSLIDTEHRLTQELELLKKDRDRRISELQESFQHEKDEWKGRMTDVEKRMKDMEQQRGQLFLEHEKEKARWNMDKDHIMAQKNEAVENATRMQKRNEALLKENEKLRAERPGKLRNPAALGKKDPSKPGVSILGTNISFQDYLASSQASLSGEGSRTSGTSPQNSFSGISELSPKSGRLRNLIPRALSPLMRKVPPAPGEPAFRFEGKDPPQ